MNRTEEQILVEEYNESPCCAKCNILMSLKEGCEWGEPPYYCDSCRIAELEEALEVYGDHVFSCATFFDCLADCDCGLIKLLAKYKEGKK